MIKRFEKNPIITPNDVKPYHANSEVIGAFNAGVAYCEGEYLMLLRVAERPFQNETEVSTWVYDEASDSAKLLTFSRNDSDYNFEDPRTIRVKSDLSGFAALTSLSYLRLARSKDGFNFKVDDEPFIYPSQANSAYGIEDARITQIEDKYFITYSQVAKNGITVGLSVTKDFESSDYLGTILAPDNKDVVLFPNKINGRYYMLHRPCLNSVAGLNIWLAQSKDLLHFGHHEVLLETKAGFESARIGAGSPPIKTKEGWLVLYHGATADHRYSTGGAILDLEDPSKVLYRSQSPIFEPEVRYEKEGFFGDVVFLTGHVVEADSIKLYYGVSDTSMAVAEASLTEIVDFIKENTY